MLKMDGAIVVQEKDAVIAKVKIKATDKRTFKLTDLTLFLELTEQDQEVRPLIERACKFLGYYYYSMEQPETVSVPLNCEKMFEIGKAQEQADLHRP